MPVINPTFQRKLNRPPMDAQLVVAAKASISATTTTPANLIETAHLDTFEVIVYGHVYTGFVAGTAQWNARLQASALETGPYIEIGSIQLVPKADGINASMILASEIVQTIVPGCQYLRVVLEKVGLPGALLAGCYLSPEEDQRY